MNLSGKVVLITGGAVRVGRGIAVSLAREQAYLIIHYNKSRREAQALVRAIGKKGGVAKSLQCELSDSAQIERFVKEAIAAFGRVDVLINNASEFFCTPLDSVTEAEWDRFMDVNLKAPFLLSRLLGREMVKRGEGKIINITDVSAVHPWADFIPYCVSKAGLVTLTQGLAKALAPRVQVNAIAPGTILSPVTGWTSRQRERSLRLIPLKRFGAPCDITRAVLFLIESDYMTGAIIPVDGGKSIA